MHEMRPDPSGYGQHLIFISGDVEQARVRATRCAGIDGSGLPAKYDVTNRGTFAGIDGSAVLPARGLISAATWVPQMM
jgi:hypothetical protein